MPIRTVIVLAVLAAALPSCRRRHAETATSSADAAAPVSAAQTTPTLSGQTRAVDAVTTSARTVGKGPEVGNDPPTPGAVVNVPALVGRSKEKVEAVLGKPVSTSPTVYSVSGQSVIVSYENGKAMWFAMSVPWQVDNAVDALRLLSVDVLNVAPKSELDSKVEFVLDLTVDLGEPFKDAKLHAEATKPATSSEWTAVGAGIRKRSSGGYGSGE